MNHQQMHLELETNRRSPVPLFFQLATQLENAIRDQRLRPGDRIENEVDLAIRLGLSRPTVARAVNELVGKGLLVRRRGIGTEVSSPSISRRVGLNSLHEDLHLSGRKVSTKILETKFLMDAPRATRLGVGPNTELLYLERIRFADGEPFALMRNWIPRNIATFDPQQLAGRGLYKLLNDSGSIITQAEQQIGARIISGHESDQLTARRGTAVLTLVRLAQDSFGNGIELGEHAYRADTYTVDLSVRDDARN